MTNIIRQIIYVYICTANIVVDERHLWQKLKKFLQLLLFIR